MQRTRSASGGAVLAVIGVAVGLALVIIGQFVLDTLADASDAWHYLQHGVFVAAGFVIGISASRLYALGQRCA